MRRPLKPEVLLAENIRTLLNTRGLDGRSLAVWCGHKPPWISKILTSDRGVQIKDLGKIADFFGLTVSDLFSQGISALTERRGGDRRKHERRVGSDRRRGDINTRVHPDVEPYFRPRGD